MVMLQVPRVREVRNSVQGDRSCSHHPSVGTAQPPGSEGHAHRRVYAVREAVRNDGAHRERAAEQAEGAVQVDPRQHTLRLRCVV